MVMVMVMVMVTMVRFSENVSGVAGSFFSFGRIICGVGLFLDLGGCWLWVLFFCGLIKVIVRSNLYYVCVLVLLVLVPVVAFLTSPKQSPDSSTS